MKKHALPHTFFATKNMQNLFTEHAESAKKSAHEMHLYVTFRKTTI